VLVSPVPDGWPVSLARSLSTRGHDLAVLSPDATGGPSADGSSGSNLVIGESADEGSPGRRVAATRRAIRLWDLRTNGATVVDWTVDDPLDLALDRSLKTLL
jgi:glycine/D-amino acid oxidase-like deaminating enzyme